MKGDLEERARERAHEIMDKHTSVVCLRGADQHSNLCNTLTEAILAFAREVAEEAAGVCEERAAYSNDIAYDKRKMGRDDNYWCGAASASAKLANTIRQRFGLKGDG